MYYEQDKYLKALHFLNKALAEKRPELYQDLCGQEPSFMAPGTI